MPNSGIFRPKYKIMLTHTAGMNFFKLRRLHSRTAAALVVVFQNLFAQS